MTRIIQKGKRRRTPLLAMALFGVIVGVLIGGGAFSSAAPSTDASVVDYSQCANGKPGTTPSNTCPSGWINGILQSSNSQYAENQVTAQRLVIDLPRNGPTTGRTITIKYLWNKGVHHAYDSLAQYNLTISGLDTAAKVCAGVPGSCPATTSNFNNGLGDSQSAVKLSSCTTNGVTTPFSAGDFVMFGGTITAVSTPTNDSATCSTSADEYETTTITYSVTSTPARVMLLFGGHLAPGLGSDGWGSGFGSHDINGGPYHIKLITLDSSSIGNRDNQISAGAILATTPSISTTPTNTGHLTFSEDLNDSVTIGNGATGTVHFYLYDNSTDCNAVPASTTVGTGGLLYKQDVTLSNGTASTDGTGTGSNNVTTTGDYYWSVHYDGDGSLNNPADSTCVEHSSFTAPTLPTVTNTGG